MKEKGKERGDKKRRAVENDITINDYVVIKRPIKENKLMSTFDPKIIIVKKRSGSEVEIESIADGKKSKRNVAHVKRVPPGLNPLLSQAHSTPSQ